MARPVVTGDNTNDGRDEIILGRPDQKATVDARIAAKTRSVPSVELSAFECAPAPDLGFEISGGAKSETDTRKQLKNPFVEVSALEWATATDVSLETSGDAEVQSDHTRRQQKKPSSKELSALECAPAPTVDLESSEGAELSTRNQRKSAANSGGRHPYCQHCQVSERIARSAMRHDQPFGEVDGSGSTGVALSSGQHLTLCERGHFLDISGRKYYRKQIATKETWGYSPPIGPPPGSVPLPRFLGFKESDQPDHFIETQFTDPEPSTSTSPVQDLCQMFATFNPDGKEDTD